MQSSEPQSSGEPTSPMPPRPGALARAAQWLWRGAEMKAVQARLNTQAAAVIQGLGEAAPLIRQADHLRDLGENEAELACLKEATRVLLRARFQSTPAVILEQHRDELQALCAQTDQLDQVFALLNELDGVSMAREQRAQAKLALRVFATGLYGGLAIDRLEKGRILAGRVGRVGAVVGVVSIAFAGASFAALRSLAPPDLTAGASWRASSEYAGCDFKARTCDGNATEVFFHTQQQDDPSIEYDLRAVKRIRRVDITNRSDCCQERAVPLIVEVSVDHKSWQEVARRAETFSSVKLSFSPTEARYVRLRANENTWLHLEKVAIRGE